jgi:hypothetical protein
MHNYDKKRNGEIHPCIECGSNKKDPDTRKGINIQHHVYLRFSDECIWLCDKCHKKVHLNPEWAYEKGYLKKHNSLPIKKKMAKDKKCNHLTYFNRMIGKHKCNLCGMTFDKPQYGSVKRAELAKKIKR